MRASLFVPPGLAALLLLPAAPALVPHGPDAMVLGQPSPGIPGGTNCITVTGATPNVRVYIVTGFVPGHTHVSHCPNVFVDIADPDVVASAVSDSQGSVTVCGFVNAGLSGRTTLIQAVDQTGCQASNLVSYTWP